MSIYEDAKDTAKKIRKKLKQEFPELPNSHFKVRTSKYAGGSSVDVSWKDFPLEKDVEAITNQYESATFDGMVDLETTHGYVDPDDGLTYRGAKYISASRDVSIDRMNKINELMKDMYDSEYYEEYKHDFHVRKQIDIMLDGQNEVLPEYRKDLFDVDKVVAETNLDDLISEYLDNFPYHQMSRAGVNYHLENIIGTQNSQSDGYSYKVHDKFGTRSLLEELLSKVERADLEKAVRACRNKAEFDEYKVNAFYDLMDANMHILRSHVEKEVKNYYLEQVKNNFKLLLQQNKNHENLLEKYKKHCHFYELDKGEETPIRKLMRYADAQGIEEDDGLKTLELFAERRYKQFLAQVKRTNPDNVHPDVKAVNIMVKLFDEMNKDKQEKIKRIMTKNDNEVIRMISTSKNRLKHGNTTILKYNEPKAINGLVFYQSAFAMLIYNQKDNKFTPVYRYGTETIEMCVGNAKKVAAKYNLDRQSVTLASKLYLRG